MSQEDKRSRYERIVPRRVDKVTKALDSLAFCANKAGYAYAPDDVDRIFNHIEAAVARTRARFEGEKPNTPGFQV
jgi:hypothetical protein